MDGGGGGGVGGGGLFRSMPFERAAEGNEKLKENNSGSGSRSKSSSAKRRNIEESNENREDNRAKQLLPNCMKRQRLPRTNPILRQSERTEPTCHLHRIDTTIDLSLFPALYSSVLTAIHSSVHHQPIDGAHELLE